MSTIALYHAYNPEKSSALVSVRQAVEALEAGLLSVKLYSEMVNAFISFGIGSLFAGLSEFLKLKGTNSSNKFFKFFDDLKVGGVNRGDNSWAFKHDYWLKRYENTSWLKLDFKTITKGFLADVVTDAKRYLIGIPKGIIDEGGDHVSDAVFE